MPQPGDRRLFAGTEPEEAQLAALLQMGGGNEDRPAQIEGGVQAEAAGPAQQVEQFRPNPHALLSGNSSRQAARNASPVSRMKRSTPPRPAEQSVGVRPPGLEPVQQCPVEQWPFRRLGRQIAPITVVVAGEVQGPTVILLPRRWMKDLVGFRIERGGHGEGVRAAELHGAGGDFLHLLAHQRDRVWAIGASRRKVG